jgi:hypothetical protein
MTALAALLALAVAAGPSDPPRRTGLETSNAARARAGLLPRKAARTEVRGRHLPTVHPDVPTYLGEPGTSPEPAPLAGAGSAEGRDDGTAEAERGTSELPVRVAERGRVETVRLASDAAPPGREGAVEPIPAAIEAPEELGAVRVAAVGVVTEVTIRMRYDP